MHPLKISGDSRSDWTKNRGQVNWTFNRGQVTPAKFEETF
jgi:uncharacterized protein involved in outer membrane biogenesis